MEKRKKELEGDISIDELARETGFRREDVLFTLEYTGALQYDPHGDVELSIPRLLAWCETNGIDYTTTPNTKLLKDECLLI